MAADTNARGVVWLAVHELPNHEGTLLDVWTKCKSSYTWHEVFAVLKELIGEKRINYRKADPAPLYSTRIPADPPHDFPKDELLLNDTVL